MASRWGAKREVLTFFRMLAVTAVSVFASPRVLADTLTWDGKYDTKKIEVTVVYFVPSDRQPLLDWRERVDYFCRRIELFHAREFGSQSTLKAVVHPEPLVSAGTTADLRRGNGETPLTAFDQTRTDSPDCASRSLAPTARLDPQ